MKKLLLNEEINKMRKMMGLNENEMTLEEADSTLMGGIAKNIYLDLKREPIGTVLSKDGQQMMNAKGEPMTYKEKVSMNYQNADLAKVSKSVDIKNGFSEFSVYYNVSFVNVMGFKTKEEAEKMLNTYLSKFKDQISGEVRFIQGSMGFADTYGIVLRMNEQNRRSTYNPNNYSYSPAQNSNDRKRATNENFDAFELNGRPVDVSGMRFFPYEQHSGTEYGVENLFYNDTNDELTPEECEQFKAKYNDYVNDEMGQAADDAASDNFDKYWAGN